MNICLMINSLARGGGAERVVSELANYWTSLGHKVVVVVLNDKVEYELNKNVDLVVLNKKGIKNKLFLAPEYIRNLYLLFKKNHYDLSISFLFQSNIINIITSQMLKKKITISERSFSVKNYEGKLIIKKILKVLYPLSFNIIAISEGVKNSLVNDFEISENKIKVIYNPINKKKIIEKANENFNIEDFYSDFNNANLNIVSVGRLIKLKNFDSLIKVIHLLKKESLNVNLTIIGEGPEKQSLESLIKSYDLEENVILYGYTNNPFKIMKKFDVFISPSKYEAFGNVVIEAMCLNLPVITLKGNGGPNEIIGKGKHGLIYEDENDLAVMLKRIILNEIDLKELKDASAFRVSEFDIEKISQEYLSHSE